MKLACSLLLLGLSHQASCFSQPNFSKPTQTSLSAKYKVFIDGEAGTTGLQVRGRIEARDDLEIISPPSLLRKDEETRKKFINEADAVILCE
jgi:N-acetyl-gamma-glutamyl-phosphate reductase